MNKIYRVIWSKTKNCYVVVSEYAKRNGKCSSSLNKKLIAAFLAAGTVMSVTGSAWAEMTQEEQAAFDALLARVNALDNYIKINSTGTAASAKGNDAIAIGLKAVADSNNSVAFGPNARVVESNHDPDLKRAVGSIAIGANALIGNFKRGSTLMEDISNAMAIGTGSSVAGLSSTVIGSGSAMEWSSNASKRQNIAGSIFGSYNYTQGGSVTLSTYDTFANSIVGVANYTKRANGAAIFGRGNSVENSYADITLSDDDFARFKSNALIISNPASTDSAITKAINDNRKILADAGKTGAGNSLVVGNNNLIKMTRVASKNILRDATILGNDNEITSDITSSITLANILVAGKGNSVTNAKSTTVIGSGNSYKYGSQNIVIGDGHTLNGTDTDERNQATNNVIMGIWDKSNVTHAETLKDTVIIGHNADAKNAYGVALGGESQADGEKSIAIGKGAHAFTIDSIAIGRDAEAGKTDGPTNGNYQEATIETNQYGIGSVAIGYNVKATGSYAVALGNSSVASGRDSMAFGNQNQAVGLYATAWGYASVAGQNEADRDTTWQMLKEMKHAGEPGEKADYGKGTTVWGHDNKSYGTFATAFGEKNTAYGIHSTAFGTDNRTYGRASVAWGEHNKAFGYDSTAFGQGTQASNLQSTAFGLSTRASGQAATAFGSVTKAIGWSTTAFGSDSSAVGSNSVAFGLGSNAYGDNSVAALGGTTGKGSVTITRGTGDNPDTFEVSIDEDGNAVGAIAIGEGAVAEKSYNIAFGKGAKAQGENSIAIGTGLTVTGKNSGAFGDPGTVSGDGSYAIGNDNTIEAADGFILGSNASVEKAGGVALGRYAVASTDAGEPGYDPLGRNHSDDTTGTWRSTAAAVSVGGGSNEEGKTVTRQIANVAAGSEPTDAVNVAQLKQVVKVVDDTKTHYYHVNSTNTAEGSNYNNDGATGTDALAAGVGAKATESGSIAIGNVTASGIGAVAIGYGSDISPIIASGDYSYAHGSNVRAEGKMATAWGSATQAGENEEDRQATIRLLKEKTPQQVHSGSEETDYGKNATAWGSRTKAYGTAATAFGIGSTAYGIGATAFGDLTKAWGRASTTFGLNTEAYGEQSTAFGTGSKALGENSFAFGSGNTAVGIQSTAFGDGTTAGTEYSTGATAFGNGTTAVYSYSTAFGENTKAYGQSSTAFGTGSKAIGNYSLAFGASNRAYGQASTAFGSNSRAIGSLTTAFGQASDAVGGGSTAFGLASKAYGVNSLAVLGGITGDSIVEEDVIKDTVKVTVKTPARGALAAGEGAIALQNYTYVIGQKAKALKLNTVAIGNSAEASGEGAIVFGNGSTVEGENSIAIGSGHAVSGSNSGAFGDPTTIKGNNSYSVGNNNTIDKDLETKETASDVFAVGNSITTVTSNSAFLGDNAAYVQAAATLDDGTTGGLKTVDKATVNDFAFGNFAGAAPVGVVSVGSGEHERRIQNVAAGLISATSTDAINGSQLYTAIDAMQFDIVAGDNVEVIKENSNGHTKYTIHSLNAIVENGTNTGVLSDTPETTTETNGNTTDLTGGNNGTTTGTGTNGETGGTTLKPTPSPEKPIEPGSDNNHTTTYTVNAADSKVDSVKVEKGEAKTKGDTTETEYTVTVKSNEQSVGEDGNIVTTPVEKTTTFTVADLDTRNKIVAGNNIEVTASGDDEKGPVTYTISATGGGGIAEISFNGDNKDAQIDSPKVLNIEGGATGELSDGNIGVESDGKDTLTVKLARDIKDVDSITVNKNIKVGDNTTIEGDAITTKTVNADTVKVGGTTIDDNGITTGNGKGPSVTKDGIDGGGKKITNVAPGTADTDAVNVSQLKNASGDIYNTINRLDNSTRKGIAGAAALAALHPMDFNPDDKMQFSAGVGNYRGETAAALGMFYRPDESVMFSLGGTFGNSDNMVNAGITFGLDGTRNRITRSRTAMAHEIVELKDHIARQDEQIAKLTELVNKLVGPEQQIENTVMFPDVPENHWAYQYVEDLQKQGIIEGYPDGLFKGGRSMTRYEFAAMLDRALLNGAKLDAKIAGEFAPELSRIRVERISGQDNDRKKVERVRVNNEEAATRDFYGSKIVTEIPKKPEAK